MNTVIERIERYTTRERERMERSDVPPMIHFEERHGSRTALCGAQVQGVIAPKDSPVDCVVCHGLVQGKFA